LLNINTLLERLNWSTELAAKYKEDKARFEALKNKRDNTNKRVTTLDRTIYVLTGLLKKIDERDSLRVPLPDKPVSEIKANLRARLSAIRTYETYLSDVKRYKRNTEKLKEQLEALVLPAQSAKEIDALLAETSEELLDVREALAESKAVERQAVALKAEIDRWMKDLKALGYARPSLVPAFDKDDDLSIYETTLKLKQLLDNNEDSICPTCLQAVDIDAIRVNVKKAEKKVKELRAIRKAHTIVEKLLELDKRYMALGTVCALDDLRSQEKAFVSKEQRLKGDAAVLREHTRLLKSIKDIEKPVKPERIPKNLDADAIEEALNTCAALERVEDEIAQLVEDHPNIVTTVDNLESLQQEIATAKETLEKIDRSFNTIMKRISEFDLKRGEYQLLMTQKLEYDTELQAIQPLLDKRDLYKALEKAYGAKGLKVNKANEILSLIENNMNKYSGLVFAEPFSFRIYATDQGVMSEVHRRKTGLATDSRLLSGSESDCFKLLFMLSLLMLVPSTQRTNFVVLDEPDSHMDSVARALFAEQYIPFLRSVVPHVFLITPKDADVFQDYDQWVVVKENGESILEIK
jgi:DNA repair exonuclease SbcCD ATPase subunit